MTPVDVAAIALLAPMCAARVRAMFRESRDRKEQQIEADYQEVLRMIGEPRG